MAIRVSQRQIYANMIGGMNSSLTTLMDLHMQNTSQKKVNKPSDDPYGMAQIMASQNNLASINQYKDNLSMAKGWLYQADSILGLVHDELTDLQGILQQGADGKLDGDQRRTLATKARGILDQLISYSNTKFGGRSLFAGHKTDTNAYERVLGLHAKDENLSDVKFKVNGDNNASVIVQFTESADYHLDQKPAFRYTTDGGKTWNMGTWDAGGKVMNAGSVTIEPVYDAGSPPLVSVVASKDPAQPQLGPENIHENDNGTWLYVSPTAQYFGDTNDAKVVQVYPGASSNTGKVTGNFLRDVAVRVDDVTGARISYSYSLDNGSTWVTGNTTDTKDLHVPGGVLTLDNAPVANEQYIIKPYRADIELTIGNNSSIVINNVGKDVFGGLYEEPFSKDGAQPVAGTNMFDLVSRAIAAFESNSQQDCQAVLGELTGTMEFVVNYRTMAGARLNRVESIAQQLDYLEYDETDRLSSLEDADLSTLLSQLSAQQLAYNSILKTSSMIMQMSLMNFL